MHAHVAGSSMCSVVWDAVYVKHVASHYACHNITFAMLSAVDSTLELPVMVFISNECLVCTAWKAEAYVSSV